MINAFIIVGIIWFFQKDSDSEPAGLSYPHTMYDCANGGQKMMANNEKQHLDFVALGYVATYAECGLILTKPSTKIETTSQSTLNYSEKPEVEETFVISEHTETAVDRIKDSSRFDAFSGL